MESFDKVEESPKEKKKKTKETRKATSAPLRKSREMEVPCLFVCLIVSFFFWIAPIDLDSNDKQWPVFSWLLEFTFGPKTANKKREQTNPNHQSIHYRVLKLIAINFEGNEVDSSVQSVSTIFSFPEANLISFGLVLMGSF